MDADGYPDAGPPPEAEGLDRPDEHEDSLDDLNEQFDGPARDRAQDNHIDDPANDSDDESLLSEVDEAQFADFDPKAVEVAPDYDQLKSIKVSKRKRAEGEEAGAKKKRREKKRERPSRRADSDALSGADATTEGKRSRKQKAPTEPKPRVEINEDDLPEEEKRRRALDRAMDAAVKRTQGKRIRRGEIVSSMRFTPESANAKVLNRTWNKPPMPKLKNFEIE